MHNELFTVGPFTIYGYGLMIAIGFAAAILISSILVKKAGLDSDVVFDLSIFAIIGGVVGAKLLYILVNIKDIFSSSDFLSIIQGGFVVYGGIILGFLLCFFYCKRKKIQFLSYFDIIMPTIFIGQGFGRLGCFLAGCCYGKEYSGPGSITFINSSYAPNNISLFPTQLVSSAYDFIMAFILIVIVSRLVKFKGQLGTLYLITYSIGRIIIEFFRGDTERGYILVLSTSQFISVIILVMSLIFYIKLKKKDGGIIL